MAYSLTWCQKLQLVMVDKLEKIICEKLELIKLIWDFVQDHPLEREENIPDLIKQYLEYDFYAQIIRKIQQKHSKKWF